MSNETLLEAAKEVLLWWDRKLAHELASNFEFPWAEDAEWDEFHDLRTAIRRVEAENARAKELKPCS